MVKKAQSAKRAVASKRPGPAKKPKKKSTPEPKAPRKRKISPAVEASKAADARRKKHLKAVELYERALEALQRRELKVAATRFGKVIEQFPEERELHERSRRYLQVCERHAAAAPAPQSLEERVYAATLALNAGSAQEALHHLEAALAEAPDSEQVQYMLAVAYAETGDESQAVTHLHRAIELNPDNRFLARHEPTFEALHNHEAFQQMLASPPDDGDEGRSTPSR